MSKLDNNLRIAWTERIADFLRKEGEEVLHEKDNILWLPTTNDEGEDKWIKINIQVPTKVEDDDDGYAKEEAYKAKKIADAEKEKAKAEAKAKKIAKDKAKREEKGE